MNRVLKKDGKIVTMTPDWELNYKIFYEDYTIELHFPKIFKGYSFNKWFQRD